MIPVRKVSFFWMNKMNATIEWEQNFIMRIHVSLCCLLTIFSAECSKAKQSKTKETKMRAECPLTRLTTIRTIQVYCFILPLIDVSILCSFVDPFVLFVRYLSHSSFIWWCPLRESERARETERGSIKVSIDGLVGRILELMTKFKVSQWWFSNPDKQCMRKIALERYAVNVLWHICVCVCVYVIVKNKQKRATEKKSISNTVAIKEWLSEKKKKKFLPFIGKMMNDIFLLFWFNIIPKITCYSEWNEITVSNAPWPNASIYWKMS